MKMNTLSLSLTLLSAMACPFLVEAFKLPFFGKGEGQPKINFTKRPLGEIYLDDTTCTLTIKEDGKVTISSYIYKDLEKCLKNREKILEQFKPFQDLINKKDIQSCDIDGGKIFIGNKKFPGLIRISSQLGAKRLADEKVLLLLEMAQECLNKHDNNYDDPNFNECVKKVHKKYDSLTKWFI
jgi:hypothetical protein